MVKLSMVCTLSSIDRGRNGDASRYMYVGPVSKQADMQTGSSHRQTHKSETSDLETHEQTLAARRKKQAVAGRGPTYRSRVSAVILFLGPMCAVSRVLVQRDDVT